MYFSNVLFSTRWFPTKPRVFCFVLLRFLLRSEHTSASGWLRRESCLEKTKQQFFLKTVKMQNTCHLRFVATHCFSMSFLHSISNYFKKCQANKAALRQSFSAYVYCMLKQYVATLKMVRRPSLLLQNRSMNPYIQPVENH